MLTRRAQAGVLTSACLVTGLLAPPVHGTPPSVQPCTQLAASPAFTADRTAFCAGHVPDPTSGRTTAIAVFRTTDGGRTWTRATAAGLTFNDTDARVTHLSVSPRYASDRTVFAQIRNTGLFQSVDGGETFSLVGPLAWSRVTPFVATAPAPPVPIPAPDAGAHTIFGMARSGGADGDPNASAIIDPLARSHTPVRGTPARDLEFAIADTFARDGAAFAVADRGVGLDARVELYRCGAMLTCDALLIAFPKRWTFDRLWLSRDFEKTRTVYVSMTTLSGSRVLYWSRDAGGTWSRWSAAERLLAPVVAARNVPRYAVAFGTSRTVYLRVSYMPGATSSAAPPAEQLFRSDDGGSTWRRVAFGRAARQAGSRGVMPTDSPIGEQANGAIPPGALTVAGSTVFMLGHTGRYAGLYCSWDGGRQWGRTCR